MHSIVVIVFDDKSKADKGKTTLLQLEADGRVGLYGYAVVAKNPDRAVVVQEASHGMLSPFGKSLLESVITSTHYEPGAVASKSGEPLTQLNTAGIAKDFINDVEEVLLPNRVAIIADIEEEFTAIVDTRMNWIRGIVFRWAAPEVEHEADTNAA